MTNELLSLEQVQVGQDLIRTPRHPYTIGLLRARMHDAMVPGARLEAIPGAPPDLSALPPGCAFAPRCRFAEARCRAADPAEVAVAPGHGARCLRTDATLELA